MIHVIIGLLCGCVLVLLYFVRVLFRRVNLLGTYSVRISKELDALVKTHNNAVHQVLENSQGLDSVFEALLQKGIIKPVKFEEFIQDPIVRKSLNQKYNELLEKTDNEEKDER